MIAINILLVMNNYHMPTRYLKMSTNDSFIKWRDSSQYHQVDSKSFVISDSEDEDIIQNSFKERLLIDESNEDNADVSQDTIPTK